MGTAHAISSAAQWAVPNGGRGTRSPVRPGGPHSGWGAAHAISSAARRAAFRNGRRAAAFRTADVGMPWVGEVRKRPEITAPRGHGLPQWHASDGMGRAVIPFGTRPAGPPVVGTYRTDPRTPHHPSWAVAVAGLVRDCPTWSFHSERGRRPTKHVAGNRAEVALARIRRVKRRKGLSPCGRPPPWRWGVRRGGCRARPNRRAPPWPSRSSPRARAAWAGAPCGR